MKVSEDIILLAEDDENHVLLIRKGFERVGLLNPLYVVRDGEEAVSYFKGEGRFANRDEYPLPTLLLLDLKMPRMDGFQVLEWVRQDPNLRRLPVVVLTSSEDIRDVNRAYDLGANSFLVKPLNMEDLIRLTTTIQGYWLWVSRAPEVERPPRRVEKSAER